MQPATVLLSAYLGATFGTPAGMVNNPLAIYVRIAEHG